MKLTNLLDKELVVSKLEKANIARIKYVYGLDYSGGRIEIEIENVIVLNQGINRVHGLYKHGTGKASEGFLTTGMNVRNSIVPLTDLEVIRFKELERSDDFKNGDYVKRIKTYLKRRVNSYRQRYSNTEDEYICCAYNMDTRKMLHLNLEKVRMVEALDDKYLELKNLYRLSTDLKCGAAEVRLETPQVNHMPLEDAAKLSTMSRQLSDDGFGFLKTSRLAKVLWTKKPYKISNDTHSLDINIECINYVLLNDGIRYAHENGMLNGRLYSVSQLDYKSLMTSRGKAVLQAARVITENDTIRLYHNTNTSFHHFLKYAHQYMKGLSDNYRLLSIDEINSSLIWKLDDARLNNQINRKMQIPCDAIAIAEDIKLRYPGKGLFTSSYIGECIKEYNTTLNYGSAGTIKLSEMVEDFKPKQLTDGHISEMLLNGIEKMGTSKIKLHEMLKQQGISTEGESFRGSFGPFVAKLDETDELEELLNKTEETEMLADVKSNIRIKTYEEVKNEDELKIFISMNGVAKEAMSVTAHEDRKIKVTLDRDKVDEKYQFLVEQMDNTMEITIPDEYDMEKIEVELDLGFLNIIIKVKDTYTKTLEIK